MKKLVKKINLFFDKMPIHPLFILFLIWFTISGKIFSFFVFILALLIHEFGHYIFAKKLGYRLSNFKLMPFGAELNYEGRFFDNKDEALIAFAGPLVNIFTSIFVVCFWWLFPTLYAFTYHFVVESMVLALVNLLPAYPLDGGRIILGIINDKIDRKKSLKVLKFSNYIFSGIFIILFVISCFTNYNPTLVLMAVFLLSGLLGIKKESKYEVVGLIKKSTKNFSRVDIRSVNNEVTLLDILKTIHPRKRTIFLYTKNNKWITEDTFVRLSLIYPLNAKIDEIINKNNSTK